MLIIIEWETNHILYNIHGISHVSLEDVAVILDV